VSFITKTKISHSNKIIDSAFNQNEARIEKLLKYIMSPLQR